MYFINASLCSGFMKKVCAVGSSSGLLQHLMQHLFDLLCVFHKSKFVQRVNAAGSCGEFVQRVRAAGSASKFVKKANAAG